MGPLQSNMYQQGLQLTVLKVLSTTQSVPNAYTVNCPNGAIESVCIGVLASDLPARPITYRLNSIESAALHKVRGCDCEGVCQHSC